MTDFEQQRSRKMTNLTEIKQELNSEEENEGDFSKSVTSNHFRSQFAIKQEKSYVRQAEEDGVHLKKVTSLTCQVKTEPQSEGEEDGCELKSMAGNYSDGFVIKREIDEVHTEDQHMMDNEVNPRKTTEDEDSGTQTSRIVKSENENFFPNFSDNNINEQNNMFDITRQMNYQQFCGKIGEETEVSHTQAKTICETYKCSVCAKAFHSRQACLQHIWNTHTGENPYSCEVCGKGFKYSSRLQGHKAVHGDERPFSCHLCQKTFKRKQNLNTHKKIVHSDEKPYSCDVCKKAFKNKGGVRYHQEAHHSNEEPYWCDLCKKLLKSKVNLKNHERVFHSNKRPYLCDVCKQTFKQKVHLDSHKMTVHSDERPYSCNACNKAFKDKWVLLNHKVFWHSNERPYSCDLCKKAFKLKVLLNYHKIRIHSD